MIVEWEEEHTKGHARYVNGDTMRIDFELRSTEGKRDTWRVRISNSRTKLWSFHVFAVDHNDAAKQSVALLRAFIVGSLSGQWEAPGEAP